MIVKIWPIKARGADSVRNTIAYITDEVKTGVKFMSPSDILSDDFDRCDVMRVIRYMADEDKLDGRYVSGYRCDPDSVARNFESTVLCYTGRPKGNVAYHIVQSFPSWLDVTNEEVHQCGIDLVRKIQKHQALICSHIHPVFDKDDKLHGKCKHNHILLNAYIDPLCLDPEHPDRIKYHDSKATYAQLRIWNDEIALDHGLPLALSKKALQPCSREDIPPRSNVSHLVELAREHTLSVKIPLGNAQQPPTFYTLPLSRTDIRPEALPTYFAPYRRYTLCDADGEEVAEADGLTLLAYFQDRGREDAQRWADEEAEIRQRYAAAKKQTHYSDPAFLCSRTKRPYRIPRYDEDGCPLTVLDLLFLLAVTVLRSEGDRWTPPVTPAEKCRSIIYLKTDYKVQAMMDALQYARDEGIERPSDIDERLDDVGAAYSRAKFSIKHNTELREKMAPLKEIVNAYEQTRATAERLYAMPDGAEKDAALRESQELLERHKEAKAALYRHHLAENDQIIDFNRRWFDAGENLRCAEERLALTKESYRKLKKLQYHAALARNEQFCYGAEYTPEKAKAAKPAAKKAMDR